MKHFFVLLAVACFGAKAQTIYFPPLAGSQWDTLSLESQQWCQPRVDSLYAYLQAKNTKSFLLLRSGRIVLENYFGTFQADSIWYWASSSKSLAALITGIAQKEGYIAIDNPVSDYLGAGWTSAPANKEALITVKHLLKMTSGLNDTPPAPCDHLDTAKTCLIYLTDPDQRWGYHTGAYRKVQDLVSAAAGLSYNTLTTIWVKNKIGMGGVWIDQVYYSKARDMARFGLLMLNRGVWASDTVLKDPAYFQAMITSAQSMNPAYGYLWWLNGKASYLNPGLPFNFQGPLIPNAPADLYCALGKNDQKIYVVPSQSLVVVRQGNSAGAPTFALSDFDNRMWDYINKLNCTTATGFLPEQQSAALRLYPNPAGPFTRVDAEASVVSAGVYDLLGQLQDVPVKDNELNLSALNAGVYHLHLQMNNGQSYFRRLVVR